MIENSSNINAFVLAGLTILLFIVHAIMHANEAKTKNDFFFAGSSLNKDGIAANLSATSSSLGTALLFLLFQTPVYGIFIFLIILMFLIGQYVFMTVASRYEVNSDAYGSIYRLVSSSTNSKSLAVFSNIITILTFFILLLIEIFIGSSILGYFFSPTHVSSIFIVGGIVAGVTAYVLIGGFRVVTFSDKWQFWLLFISAACTVFYLLYLGAAETPPISAGSAVSVLFEFPEGSSWVLATFVLNVIIVNTLLPLCQASSWQRFGSSKNKDEFSSGYKKAFFTQLIWAWLLFAFVSAIFFRLNDSGEGGLPGLFSLIDNSSTLGHLFILPLLFAGLTAALVSTADSLMVAIFLAIDDFYGNASDDTSSLEEEKSSSTFRRRLFSAFIIGALIVAAYHFFTTQAASFQATIVGLMFTSVGQTVLLFPPIFFSLYFADTRRINGKLAIGGMLLSLCVLWVIAVAGILNGNFILNQIAPIVALAVGLLIMRFAFAAKEQ